MRRTGELGGDRALATQPSSHGLDGDLRALQVPEAKGVHNAALGAVEADVQVLVELERESAHFEGVLLVAMPADGRSDLGNAARPREGDVDGTGNRVGQVVVCER